MHDVETESWAGQCFCGAVRFRMHGRPMFIHCCHCRDCQQQTGSAFAFNGLIEAERIERIEGEPVKVAMRTDSGHPHAIYRCASCHSAVWSDYGDRDWLRFVRLTALDRPGDFVPDVHIYTKTRLPWVALPAEARIFEEYYDTRAEWPAESMARFKLARDRARQAAG